MLFIGVVMFVIGVVMLVIGVFGGEGGNRTPKTEVTDLLSVRFDRFHTSPCLVDVEGLEPPTYRL